MYEDVQPTLQKSKRTARTNLTGQSYTAKLRRPISATARVIGVFRPIVAADRKTAKASFEERLQNRTTDFDAVEQWTGDAARLSLS